MGVFANLKLQIISNYFIITKKHEVICIILINQFIDKTVSNYKEIMKLQQAPNIAWKKNVSRLYLAFGDL